MEKNGYKAVGKYVARKNTFFLSPALYKSNVSKI